MYLYILILLYMSGFIIGKETWKEQLPWDVKVTLLDLYEDYNIGSIQDDVTPIYRKDLRQDYAAYWEIPFNFGEYFILSSGPQTGDFRLVFKGEYSPIHLLDETAKQQNTSCLKYYMVAPTPGFLLACKDGLGKLIVDLPAVVHESGVGDIGNNAAIWHTHRKHIQQNGVNYFSNKDVDDDDFIHYHLLQPGSSKHLLVSEDDAGELEVQAERNSDSQALVCGLLNVCLADNINRIDPQKVQLTQYGQRFLKLNVPEAILNQEHIGTVFMELNVRSRNTIQTTRLALEPNNRVKRTTPSNRSLAIKDEIYFPDYNQHFIRKCTKYLFWNTCKPCAVGCGPVAWAMIFGFFDRRSHAEPDKYGTGSQSLFTCGNTGMFGNTTCIAPDNDTSITENYIRELHNFLGTFCLSGSGATTTGDMKNVELFFKENQKTGNPKIITDSSKWFSFLGNYNDEYRDKAIEYIEQGWPAIVGIRLDVEFLGIKFKEFRFGQHYPVATRYNERVYKSIKCKGILGFFRRNCENGLMVEREFYLHWGWGKSYQENNGYDENWVPARVFFVGVAKY